MLRNAGKRYGNEIRASALSLVLALVFSLFSAIFYGWNIFILVPLISIAVNIATTYLIIVYLKKPIANLMRHGKDAASLLICLLFMNIIYSIFVILLRGASNDSEAVIWSLGVVSTTYIILLGLIHMMIIFPRKIFSESIRRGIFYVFFFVFIFFLIPSYVYRFITGQYSAEFQRVNGVYPELSVIGAVFGPIRPFASFFFLIIAIFIMVLVTYQFISLSNRSIKRYYRYVWAGFMLATGIAIVVIFFIGTILGKGLFMFYSIETIIFTPAVTYYMIRISVVEKRLSDIQSGTSPIGEIEIFVVDGPEDIIKAKKELIKRASAARDVIIFSLEDEEDFLPNSKELMKRAIYIKITDRGYVVNNTFFSRISDLSQLYGHNKSDFRGIVVYSNTLREVLRSKMPSEEKKTFYYVFQRFINGGALVISPIEREHLNIGSDKKLIRTKNPVWYISPLLALRMEEYLNELYMRIPEEKRHSFLEMLVGLEEKGLPYERSEANHIILSLSAGMDCESFVRFVELIRDFVISRNMMGNEEFRSMVNQLFLRYGDDYETTVVIKNGMMYIIEGEEPMKKAMKKAIILSEQGRPAFVISRTNPEILRRMFSLGDMHIKWLTDISGKEDVVIPQPESVKKEIFDFLDENADGVVVLDGIEYLSRIYGFDSVFQLMWILKDHIATTDAIMFLPMNLGSFNDKDAETLRREFFSL